MRSRPALADACARARVVSGAEFAQCFPPPGGPVSQAVRGFCCGNGPMAGPVPTFADINTHLPGGSATQWEESWPRRWGRGLGSSADPASDRVTLAMPPNFPETRDVCPSCLNYCSSITALRCVWAWRATIKETVRAMRRNYVLNLTVLGSWAQEFLFPLVCEGPNPLGPDPEGPIKLSSLSRRVKSGPRRYRKPTYLSQLYTHCPWKAWFYLYPDCGFGNEICLT